MRRMITTKLNSWIKQLFKNMQPNGENVEFGKDIEVDGKVKVNSASDLTDKNGNPLPLGGSVTRQAIFNASGMVTPLSSPRTPQATGVDETNAQSFFNFGDGIEVDGITSPYNLNVVGRVKVLKASDINPNALTDEQIELIKSGVFVNGEISGQVNPVLCPPFYNDGGTIAGNYISNIRYRSYGGIGVYTINAHALSFSTASRCIALDSGGNFLIGDKYFPSYPTTEDGVLFWNNTTSSMKWLTIDELKEKLGIN